MRQSPKMSNIWLFLYLRPETFGISCSSDAPHMRIISFIWNRFFSDYFFQNGREELDKLLKFLGIDLDEKLKGDIIEMCGFQKMSVEKERDETLQELKKKDFQFFRKGIFNFYSWLRFP